MVPREFEKSEGRSAIALALRKRSIRSPYGFVVVALLATPQREVVRGPVFQGCGQGWNRQVAGGPSGTVSGERAPALQAHVLLAFQVGGVAAGWGSAGKVSGTGGAAAAREYGHGIT